ncbi:reticulocyte-binding protein 2 homolog a, partial [Haematococcus lacustris]
LQQQLTEKQQQLEQQQADMRRREQEHTELQHQLQQQQAQLSQREQDLTERQHQLQQQQANLHLKEQQLTEQRLLIEQQARTQTLQQRLHRLQQEVKAQKAVKCTRETVANPSHTSAAPRPRQDTTLTPMPSLPAGYAVPMHAHPSTHHHTSHSNHCGMHVCMCRHHTVSPALHIPGLPYSAVVGGHQRLLLATGPSPPHPRLAQQALSNSAQPLPTSPSCLPPTPLHGGTATGLAVRAWARSLTEYFSACRMPVPQWVPYAAGLLTGGAEVWWRQQVVYNAPAATCWAAFVGELCEHYTHHEERAWQPAAQTSATRATAQR